MHGISGHYPLGYNVVLYPSLVGSVPRFHARSPGSKSYQIDDFFLAWCKSDKNMQLAVFYCTWDKKTFVCLNYANENILLIFWYFIMMFMYSLCIELGVFCQIKKLGWVLIMPIYKILSNIYTLKTCLYRVSHNDCAPPLHRKFCGPYNLSMTISESPCEYESLDKQFIVIKLFYGSEIGVWKLHFLLKDFQYWNR